jgi:hypothetical protein
MSRQIVTDHVRPPIPYSGYDWSATYDDYQPGDAIGWGFTREGAIEDLKRETGDSQDE